MESKQPIISVIVSTYNRQKKLKRAVESILNQTFQDFEIVIVDDASTDKTPAYCEKLVKKYPGKIVYKRLEENWGRHGKPKNEGIKISRGQLVAFLDDDNEYLKDHLQALFNEMVRNPQAHVVYGDRFVVNEKEPKQKQHGVSGDFNLGRLMMENYIDTSDVLIQKEALLEVGGWDDELKKFADWNLFVRLGKAGKHFLHVPKILTNYYFHDDMNQMKHQSPIDPETGRLLPTFDPMTVMIWANQSTFGEFEPLRVAIFTLTMDRLEYTKKTIESLAKYAGYPYDHYIVDNGSSDKTVAWLEANKEKYNIKQIIKNEKNVGISKGSNQALDAIGKGYDVIIKLDNDCEIQTEGIIEDIVNIFARTKRIIVSPNVEGLIDNAGGPPRENYVQMGPLLLGAVRHLGGIFCAGPAEWYENFRWKEDDFLHGMQDTIFSQTSLQHGFGLCYIENQRVMHIDSTYGQKEKFKEYFKRRETEKVTKYAYDR